MKKSYLLLTLFIAVLFSACDKLFPIPSTILRSYYVYIAGDSGRKVKITRLHNSEKNKTVQEEVTLPFLGNFAVQEGGSYQPKIFIEICTDALDSTTKSIIFENYTPWRKSGAISCVLSSVFYTELNDPSRCNETKGVTRDSAMIYLKKIQYPNYVEFKKGETCKRIDVKP